MNYGYTREEILDKIEMLISQSHNLSWSLLDYGKGLDDNELEKFLVLVYEALQREKKLYGEEKAKLMQIVKDYYAGAIYQYHRLIRLFLKNKESQNVKI
ncbi:MAG: hypothetical protein V3575_04190 [Candidatus Absconditabacteria bacterium]